MEAEESGAEETKTKEEIESDITKAMLSLLPDFKNQADKLTLEGVRRALEKDMGMEKLSLDAHKKFIKQCLEKYFYEDDAKNTTETEGKIAEDPVQPGKEVPQTGDRRDIGSDLNEKLEGSPVSGGPELVDREMGKSHNSCGPVSEINEEKIKKAIRKRAAYFRSNLEITLVKVRRLLEEDLKLEERSLDAYKKFISNELDAILQSSESVQATNGSKELKKNTDRKVTEKTSKGAKKLSKDSDSLNSDDVPSDEEGDEEETRKPQKRPVQKIIADRKGLKRQKISTDGRKASGTAKKKPVKEDSEKSDENDGGKSYEDHSQSSEEEEEVKKKSEKPAQIYGKQVEHLKSIIKSCGIGIPPSVYRRVKQAPERKREAHLIKELEEILEKEGLSTDPSEKEIKAVKKRKERAKELEGIDMSNIVSSSRRRTSSSFIPPPKPKIESESEDEEGEDEDDEENEEDSEEGGNDGEESSEGSDGDEADEESD